MSSEDKRIYEPSDSALQQIALLLTKNHFHVAKCLHVTKCHQLAPDCDRVTFVQRYLFGVDRLRRRLLDGVSGRVLDVACGSGANFPSFSAADHITAVDLSPGMLDIARRRAENLGLPLDLQVMDVQQLDFTDGSLDVVVSALSTCTFSDPVAVFREISRVAKQDGRILLLEHRRSSWGLLGRLQDRGAYVTSMWPAAARIRNRSTWYRRPDWW